MNMNKASMACMDNQIGKFTINSTFVLMVNSNQIRSNGTFIIKL
jgi:hypothetical protein